MGFEYIRDSDVAQGIAYAEGAQELSAAEEGIRNIPQHQTSVTLVKSSSVTACETAPSSNATLDMLLAHYNIENVDYISPEGGWKKSLSVLFS